jgi:ABC-type dipeptide/oligopeptide/nickel transport system permease subunit
MMGINFKHVAAGAIAGAGASFVISGVSPMNGAIIGAIAGAAGGPVGKLIDSIMPETTPAAAA